ncbi:hypothetical protein BD779DRAFT_1551533 [Infundibulicybe gibba]|nr:hypothetical protein BD779DRAFT_1551533 [Infundibulicybe gibba]
MMNLPVEILRKIFLQLCSPQIEFPLHSDEPRLAVTHVCSQWRAIALSIPALWVDFYIHAQDPYRAQQSDLIRAWISQASQYTISIELLCSTDYIGVSPLIVDFVLPVIHRCSSLDLHLNATTFSWLLMLPPTTLRALQSIKILARPEIADLNVPWHQLTTLDLYSFTIPACECLDIVRQCISLHNCSIVMSPVDGVALQRIIDLSHHPTVLPSLHTLYIKFPDSEDDNFNDNFMFLRALRLPCLRSFYPELQLWTTTHPALWSLSVLQSVPYDILQELNLSLFPTSESLGETLARIPNLEILWLHGHHCPHLTRLELGVIPSWDLLFDTLEARVAAARANGITTFITLVDVCDDFVDEARLLALRGDGMPIIFQP